ncbi:zinc finger protein [Botrytis cinerea]
MYDCEPCDRYFNSKHSYDQHVMNSSAHLASEHSDGGYSSNNAEPEFQCSGCNYWFWSSVARENHHVSQHGHRYCKPCKQMFMNENNLMQHQHSKVHQGSSMKCPFCPNQYPTVSALIIHLESGRCPSGSNRERINAEIRRLDKYHVITTPLIENSSSTNIATERSWNGFHYECPMCNRGFSTLQALNSHLGSPVHDQRMYRCPGRSCGREFSVLSGLVQHVESESCGVMRFSKVQKSASDGIDRVVKNLIGS